MPHFASFTLAFALQMRKEHGKTSVRVEKYTYYQTPTQYKTYTHTHTHTTKQYKTITVQIKTNKIQDIPK